MRALCFAILELLRDQIDLLECFDDIAKFFGGCSTRSLLSKHWIDKLLRPLFLMLLYICAEHEGDFSLFVYACNNVIPYFFSAGYINYACYGICYLRTMGILPGHILGSFLNAQYAMHYQK